MICPDCGLTLAFRPANLGRARWMTPSCHEESVDEEGRRTVNGNVV